MLFRIVLFSLLVLPFAGCHMSSWDAEHGCSANGMCGGNGTSVDGCDSDGDCASNERCSRAGRCVQSNPTNACTSDAQCAQGSYCDPSQNRCEIGTPCDAESDCGEGFNCNLARATCEPAAAPTCGELGTEAECVGRSDCVTVYAGVNCSCGADCTCKGGEAGCVCQSFEFFRCAPAS